jgi:hypothetical protein
MNTAAYLIVTVLVATACWFAIRGIVRAYSKYRGTRITTCPETGRPAIVEVDALHAALTSRVGLPEIRLQNCSRWPMKKECGQDCLANLDVAPDECLVSGVLMRWYGRKKCVYCASPFAEIHWIDHKPALRSPEGKLVVWSDIQLTGLRHVMETHLPVCWNCYITQSFRLEHPDLVVYRPWTNGVHGDTGGRSVSRPR